MSYALIIAPSLREANEIARERKLAAPAWRFVSGTYNVRGMDLHNRTVLLSNRCRGTWELEDYLRRHRAATVYV